MNELPVNLIVPCCVGKSCGNVEIYLDGTLSNKVLKYVYRRSSNDDFYTRPMSYTEMLNWVNHEMPPLNEE